MRLFFTKLFSILTRHDKKFLFILFFISIIVSLIEMIGVSAILPFINIASNFSNIHSNTYIERIYTYFHFSSNINFVVAIGLALLIFYFLRSLLNLGYFYLLAKFSKGRYHLIAYRLFENYLGMSYRSFIDKNSADLSKAIVNEAQNMTALISGLLLMLSEIFVVIFIYSIMLYINWKITLLISTILIVNALFLTMTVSRAIKKAGISREEHQKKFFEIIQISLGNFKMMKLTSNTESILEKFDHASAGYASANIRNETLSHFPRIFLEALGFGIIIFMIIYLVQKYQSDISGVLALISMFVLGLYRLMPSANRILSGYNQILFFKNSLDIIHNDLMYDAEELQDIPVSFNEILQLDHIRFEYNEGKPILNDLSLTIHKGDRIAFIGESGSGKSTLIDLIIGLYRPKSGTISVDGTLLDESNIKAWRSKIGYIPQSIYLFDGTVAQNVAFGKPIDNVRIKESLRQAKILEFLETHHQGINTIVGEGGIKLSGGQRQRIAIARALYGHPEILVLDEATSALDNETEAKIMEELYRICEDKTLIVIAHRLSTIEKCQKIYVFTSTQKLIRRK
ncbi:ABC transporter ATP-binding protein [Sulfuricurvum sp.]|uniref:ABC transporter ATP-binding protein n=1 Tax=Sulfuricurvum sp. TaxID=2025608 RepID=UPI00262989FF|nr:ABC transporter ATP-binding protein [Sulfuricurvum sp.]MDD2267525.1 ABC transporter ATP-binding protein [Sulfuricurvum sp.]MDD2783679.1 ABC transporter ATP-binding protein [Sulfuricurvum sp.]